ncbi:MAG: hypothetical protein FJ050_01535 [Cyanobacteria bacterium M_surface_7_m2_040]|nr:hypothetical protein [Cyanobacteria bacterium K_DeepCast_35m_m2_023]MBM5826733.1 hypothetical protein [Cyanobacteria bacterium M_surface_7_m2_040]
MAEITADTSLQELAAIISQALEAQGLMATLSGGAAVSIYTNNRYQSHDLNFVSTAGTSKLARAVSALGFVQTPAQRLFSHPATAWLLEFPAGPLGFGQKVVSASALEAISTPFGPMRIITPTLCVMDRLAAYLHWKDRQCYDQAAWVAQNQTIEWEQVKEWAAIEGMNTDEWLRFYKKSINVKTGNA